MCAQVLKCQNCGAPLGAQNAKCEYCGAISKAPDPTLGEAAATFGKTLGNTISSALGKASTALQDYGNKNNYSNQNYNQTYTPNPWDNNYQQQNYAPVPLSAQKKSKLLAVLLALFLGWIGIHRFYIGDKKSVSQGIGFIVMFIVFSVLSRVTSNFLLAGIILWLIFFLNWLVDFIRVCVMTEARLNLKYTERK